MEEQKNIIENAFERRDDPEIRQSKEIQTAVNETIELLDNGSARVAELVGNRWVVNQWLKKAVLLSFIADENFVIKGEHTNYPNFYEDAEHDPAASRNIKGP